MNTIPEQSSTAPISGWRVFISYAHENSDTAACVEARLKALNAIPLSDRVFAHGSGFPEQIKTQIAYSHVFMPIVTPESSQRGWVHQEIGYATALNVPVLPIAVGLTPGEMLRDLHAITIREGDDVASQLDRKLRPEVFVRLLDEVADSTQSLYVCAEESEDRATLFHRYATQIRNLGYAGIIRQSSTLSSFHIPTETPEHRIWKLRYAPNQQRSVYHCRLQRQERLALEWHACRAGAKLIIRPEVILAGPHGPVAARTRIQTLVDFLTTVDDQVEVAHASHKRFGENVTIIGDWLCATSLLGTPETGYRQTIYTRHVPTILKQIELFDRQFDDAAKFEGQGTSRECAINYLRSEISKLAND